MKLLKLLSNYKIYIIAIICDFLSFCAMRLAAGSRDFANVYSETIYHCISTFVGTLTGFIPLSLVEILLYVLAVFVLADFLRQMIHISMGISALLRPSSVSSKPLAKLFCPVFLLHLFLIASLLFTLYVFNCGINYRRSSFSAEAGLGTVEEDVNEETLVSMCEYIIKNINETTDKLISSTYSEPSIQSPEKSGAACDGSANSDQYDSIYPLRLYNGAYIGETMSTPRANASFLWNAGTSGQKAMAEIGQKYERLSGPYPFPKPVMNSWILSVQQTTGVYSPFTIEANYNRDIPYYDIPFTICHELSHLKGYMQEEEANFIAVLATIGSDDLYYNYSGFVSAWVYAGNALYKINPAKFSELYGTINACTLQDLKYNNEYWDQYESKIADVQEEINDAYLKSNGQTGGVQSYGHVTDLMVTYFAEHGELRY